MLAADASAPSFSGAVFSLVGTPYLHCDRCAWHEVCRCSVGAFVLHLTCMFARSAHRLWILRRAFSSFMQFSAANRSRNSSLSTILRRRCATRRCRHKPADDPDNLPLCELQCNCMIVRFSQVRCAAVWVVSAGDFGTCPPPSASCDAIRMFVPSPLQQKIGPA